MCQIFDYAAATQEHTDNLSAKVTVQAEAALRKVHSDVDCSGIQKYFIFDEATGGVAVVCHMPLVSESSVLAMFAVPKESVGTKGEYMVPCPDVKCSQSNIDAFMDCEKYVPKPMIEPMPLFRSLGMSDEPSSIEVPTTRFMRNLNGSCQFLLSTSNILLNDSQIDSEIAVGTYENRPHYLSTVSTKIMDALLRSMRENDVDLGNVFELDEEGEVHPLALLAFVDQLLPNLRVGQELIVVVPPFDNGKPLMNGAVSIAFKYPEPVKALPLLGLVHNFDPSLDCSEQEVEADFYVLSNKPVEFDFYNPESEVRTRVKLVNRTELLPEMPHSYRNRDDVHYRSLVAEHRVDYDAYFQACDWFQRQREAEIWNSLNPVLDQIGFPRVELDASLFVNNLIGRKFHRDTTSFVLVDAPAENGAAVRKRVDESRSRKKLKKLPLQTPPSSPAPTQPPNAPLRPPSFAELPAQTFELGISLESHHSLVAALAAMTSTQLLPVIDNFRSVLPSLVDDSEVGYKKLLVAQMSDREAEIAMDIVTSTIS